MVTPIRPTVVAPNGPSIVRDMLFGDMPLNMWPPDGSPHASSEPWASFIAARSSAAEGRLADATALWTEITRRPCLESRHYIQAWHFLRSHGVNIPQELRQELLGVVMEIPINFGLDVLAAYRDMTVRYINHGGATVVWERPDASLDALTTALLTTGERANRRIGIWKGLRPAAPTAGHMRLNFLSPAGLAFGQGPFDKMANETLLKPAIAAGTALMQGLLARCGPPGT